MLSLISQKHVELFSLCMIASCMQFIDRCLSVLLHCLDCVFQSTSINVPDTAELFPEEDIDSSGASNNTDSAASTPRAANHHSNKITQPSITLPAPPPMYDTIMDQGYKSSTAVNAGNNIHRPANTYENTPVAPSLLPGSASSSVSVTILSSIVWMCMSIVAAGPDVYDSMCSSHCAMGIG